MEDKKRGIIYIIGFAIVAVILVVILGKSDSKTPSKQKVCTATTMGTIIDLIRKDRDFYDWLEATYIVDGVEYTTTGYFSDAKGKKRGAPVIVHYNPENPKVSYAAERPPVTPNHVETIIIIVVLILFFYVRNKGES